MARSPFETTLTGDLSPTAKGVGSTSASSGSPRRVTFDESSFEPLPQDIVTPAVSDLLLKLSNAVAEAQSQVEEERQRRRLLELENETMRIKIRSLSILNPEAAAAFDAAVGVLDTAQLQLPTLGRERAFTTAGDVLADPMAVCHTASLEDALTAVGYENPASVIAVRQIHRLGFDPAQTLAGYFSVFGAVREVVQVSGTDGALVVMADPEAAARTICPTGVRTVNGVMVEVCSFDSTSCSSWGSHRSSLVGARRDSGTSSQVLTVPKGARCHAQTWDASSRPHASSSVSNSGDSGTEGDQPRMNLLEALQVSSSEDEKNVFTVRKVHKLGFKSQHALRQHFSQFGRVKDVVLLPMRAKPKPGPGGQVRGVRPSSMGFVVMQTADAVGKVMAHSGGHTVKGWPIEVRPFVRPTDRDYECQFDKAASSTAESAAMMALDH